MAYTFDYTGLVVNYTGHYTFQYTLLVYFNTLLTTLFVVVTYISQYIYLAHFTFHYTFILHFLSFLNLLLMSAM